jgi:hypothetical protein
MSITPKNWKSFQHYKERTPSWIKLHKGLLTDFAFTRLPVASRALAPMLWLLASEYEGGEITASLEEVAFRVHMSEEELLVALSPLIGSGFFVSSEVLAKPERDSSSRRGEKRTIIEEKTFVATAPKGNSDFEEFKKAYPRRAGNYGWAAAEKKFNSLVKTGVDAKIIIAAAVKLCQTLRSRINTEFIPMPASWLNSEDFTDIAADAFEAEQTDWDAVIKSYQRLGQWSERWGGPAPGEPNCRVPQAKLVQYGLCPAEPLSDFHIPKPQPMQGETR